jgi:hypothetical protein
LVLGGGDHRSDDEDEGLHEMPRNACSIVSTGLTTRAVTIVMVVLDGGITRTG